VAAYPEAETILVVQDNLNTHTKAALYEVFEAPEAHCLANTLGFHFTPKHGSWLNVQELAWSALARQALSQRVGDREQLEHLVKLWLQERRERAVKIDWQFTTEDARVRLKRLYPIMTS
jgi:transposase